MQKLKPLQALYLQRTLSHIHKRHKVIQDRIAFLGDLGKEERTNEGLFTLETLHFLFFYDLTHTSWGRFLNHHVWSHRWGKKEEGDQDLQEVKDRTPILPRFIYPQMCAGFGCQNSINQDISIERDAEIVCDSCQKHWKEKSRPLKTGFEKLSSLQFENGLILEKNVGDRLKAFNTLWEAYQLLCGEYLENPDKKFIPACLQYEDCVTAGMDERFITSLLNWPSGTPVVIGSPIEVYYTPGDVWDASPTACNFPTGVFSEKLYKDLLSYKCTFYPGANEGTVDCCGLKRISLSRLGEEFIKSHKT